MNLRRYLYAAAIVIHNDGHTCINLTLDTYWLVKYNVFQALITPTCTHSTKQIHVRQGGGKRTREDKLRESLAEKSNSLDLAQHVRLGGEEAMRERTN